MARLEDTFGFEKENVEKFIKKLTDFKEKKEIKNINNIIHSIYRKMFYLNFMRAVNEKGDSFLKLLEEINNDNINEDTKNIIKKIKEIMNTSIDTDNNYIQNKTFYSFLQKETHEDVELNFLKNLYKKISEEPNPCFFSYIGNDGKINYFYMEKNNNPNQKNIIKINGKELTKKTNNPQTKEGNEDLFDSIEKAKQAVIKFIDDPTKIKSDDYFILNISGELLEDFSGYSLTFAFFIGFLKYLNYNFSPNIYSWAYIAAIDADNKIGLINVSGVNAKIDKALENNFNYILVGKSNEANSIKAIDTPNIFLDTLERIDDLSPKLEQNWYIRKLKIISGREYMKTLDRDFSGISFNSKFYPKINNKSIIELLEDVWNNKNRIKLERNFYIKGDGGIGKSSLFIHLLNIFSIDEGAFLPLPIYVSLKNYEAKKDFIKEYIKTVYDISDEELKILYKPQTNKDNPKYMPSILLMLNGINEITINKNLLDKEISELSKIEGIQLIINSRDDINIGTTIDNIENLIYDKLTADDVKKYLIEKDLYSSIENNSDLLELMRTVMFLKIFTDAAEIEQQIQAKANHNVPNYLKLKDIKTEGELIDYFVKLEEYKLVQNSIYQVQNINYIIFLIRILIPEIAFFMYEKNKNNLSDKEVKECINYFKNEKIKTEIFKEFIKDRLIFEKNMNENKTEISSFLNNLDNDLLDDLIRSSLFLYSDNITPYEFIHQNYKDFFVSKHIENDMKYHLYLLGDSNVENYIKNSKKLIQSE